MLYENKGLGRTILSPIIHGIGQDEYPVYLHTHPSFYRAVNLYTDFRFSIISDDIGGAARTEEF